MIVRRIIAATGIACALLPGIRERIQSRQAERDNPAVVASLDRSIERINKINAANTEDTPVNVDEWAEHFQPKAPVKAKAAEPVRYTLKKVCEGGACRMVKVPVSSTAKGSCPCDCPDCTCDKSSKQGTTNVRTQTYRRGLFGWRRG